MKYNIIRIQELEKGMIAITKFRNTELKDGNLRSGIMGIRFYLNVTPDSKHIHIFENFVIANLTSKYRIEINDLSDAGGYYFEVKLIFENPINFETKKELYGVIKLIVGFQSMLESILGSKDYDGYHADLYCEKQEELKEIFLKVNNETINT